MSLPRHPLTAVVAGDAVALEQMAGSPLPPNPDEPLVLSAEAVVRVLEAFRDDRLDARLAQRWASLMRFGYRDDARAPGPVRPVDIDFEQAKEDEIVEAVARLDELGDLVDGELHAPEIDELIAALRRGTATTP